MEAWVFGMMSTGALLGAVLRHEANPNRRVYWTAFAGLLLASSGVMLLPDGWLWLGATILLVPTIGLTLGHASAVQLELGRWQLLIWQAAGTLPLTAGATATRGEPGLTAAAASVSGLLILTLFRWVQQPLRRGIIFIILFGLGSWALSGCSLWTLGTREAAMFEIEEEIMSPAAVPRPHHFPEPDGVRWRLETVVEGSTWTTIDLTVPGAPQDFEVKDWGPDDGYIRILRMVPPSQESVGQH